jgi:hypothetical protein
LTAFVAKDVAPIIESNHCTVATGAVPVVRGFVAGRFQPLHE